jgi:hypothetical protein
VNLSQLSLLSRVVVQFGILVILVLYCTVLYYTILYYSIQIINTNTLLNLHGE